jgi:HK97 family phage major capsid protein
MYYSGSPFNPVQEQEKQTLAANLRHKTSEIRRLEGENKRLKGEARGARADVLKITEPAIYGAGRPHSWFRDVASIVHPDPGNDEIRKAAGDRLDRHHRWQHQENERRLAALSADAEMTAFRAASQTRAEAALMHRWLAEGGHVFEQQQQMRDLERRAASRTDGQGGYFTVPGYLADMFVHAPRAGAPFAALWQRVPMPENTTSINLPKVPAQGGMGSGVQGGDLGAVPSRDPSDALVTAQVKTLTAQVDVSQQLMDQSPVPLDQTFGQDISEDLAMQLDGQLLLGGGTGAGQLPGVIPAGAFSASNMIWLQSTTNVSGMSWSNGAGATPGIAGSLHQATAQLYRKIARYRALEPTAWVVPASVWAIITGSGVDGQDRPLNPPTMHGLGHVPMLHGLPIVIDENIPETFGGTIPPGLSTVSAGRLAPADGNGTWVPILCGRWADCLYFQSDPVVRVMPQVLGATLQVRFQVYCYVAAMPARVVWGGTSATFSGTNQGGGVNNGAPCAFGAVTNFVSNSILQPASAGY